MQAALSPDAPPEPSLPSGAGANGSEITSEETPPSPGLDDFTLLQRRLIQATLAISALAVLVTALVFNLHTAGSVLVGAMAGVLYLRLLARSVAKLGPGSKSVSKFQLLVPALLVVASARLPQLDLLPALIGFLLYKPAVLLQAFSRA